LTIKVAVAQTGCRLGDLDWNMKSIFKMSKRIARYEPDIVCFPELATTGYSLNEKWRKYAERIPGPTSERLSSTSTEFGFYMICGMIEADVEENRIYNSAVLTDPNGAADVYRKVHLWGMERRYFTPGTQFRVMKTKIAKIGIGICYDLEFPESARELALQGARVIFYSSAEPRRMKDHADVYIRSRAAENCLFVCHSNRVGREGKLAFFGGSQIASPLGNIIRKGDQPGFAIAQLDLSSISRLRRERFPYLTQRVDKAYSHL